MQQYLNKIADIIFPCNKSLAACRERARQSHDRLMQSIRDNMRAARALESEHFGITEQLKNK